MLSLVTRYTILGSGLKPGAAEVGAMPVFLVCVFATPFKILGGNTSPGKAK
jgi:hypothetical protein